MKLLPRGLLVGSLVGCALVALPMAADAQPTGRPAAPAASRLSLQVGAQQTLDVPGLMRVTVADPGVADVRTAAARLTVKGMAPGRTTLTVWVGEARTTYEVVVR